MPTEKPSSNSEGQTGKTLQQTGLNADEVLERKRRFGLNEVSEKKESLTVAFAKKFWGLVPWILEITIVLSLILGNYLDLYIITALLLINAVLGFIQEQQATRAVKALKQKLQIQARVLRNSVWESISALEIVPDDIIRVRLGDFAPADFNILKGEVSVDQSAITGESLPIEKKQGDIVYSGSLIKMGEVTGVVKATGVHTYFGKTAQLVQLAKPRLHMENVISRLMKWLVGIVAVLLVVVGLISLVNGENLYDLLPLALILLVSAVPVALPTVFTITMALGSYELTKKGVLITRLSASEDAALMDTLCVDKTGTITENKLSVGDIVELNNYSKDDVLVLGALASQKANQDPIDMAFFNAVENQKLSLDDYKRVSFTPFNPATRRIEASVEKQGENIKITKGAVSAVEHVCCIKEEDTKGIDERIKALAGKGYRVIAVAAGKEKEPLNLAGLVALYDKPRSDSKKFIAKLNSIGIRVKMLTGDSQPIAQQIAQEVGLNGKIVNVSDIENKTNNALNSAELVEQSDGFAEIYPEGKYRIVKGLQARKHVVGMTGDGINDAAALKQAEVGIAVSNATDVAKSSASAVLTEQGLSNILDLVQTGRKIYQRILTWMFNKIVKTFQIVLFIIIAFLLTGLYIVDAFQVVLLLFLVDFVTISISTDNVRPSLKPETWDVTGLVKSALLLGVAITMESLGLLYIGVNFLNLSGTGMLNTFAFDMMLFGGLFTIFVVRERKHFWNSKPSTPLLTAITADIIISSIISMFGIPGLAAIPIQYVLLVLAWFFVFGLLINDQLKTRLLPNLGFK